MAIRQIGEHKRRVWIACAMCVVTTTGCIVTPEGIKSIGRILSPPCSGVPKQIAYGYELTVKVTDEAEVGGKLTPHQAVAIRDDAYRAMAKTADLCNLLVEGQLTPQQYLEELDKTDRHFERLRQMVAGQATETPLQQRTSTPIATATPTAK